MAQPKYKIILPKSKAQFESELQNIFKKNPNLHYIFRVFENYILLEELSELLLKYQDKIVKFKKNKSMVVLIEDIDYEQIPEFMSVAPTEEEAVDIIDFEEIERDFF